MGATDAPAHGTCERTPGGEEEASSEAVGRLSAAPRRAGLDSVLGGGLGWENNSPRVRPLELHVAEWAKNRGRSPFGSGKLAVAFGV
jgi:hypothetical protein